jgi:YHS domain-containing protein
MKRLFCLLSGMLVASVWLPTPGTQACCGPDMPPLRCPVAGLGKDLQPDLCPGFGPYVYHHCHRKVTLKSPSRNYRGGQIYFCCPHCIPVFQQSPERFAANANWQLVVTYQAWQIRCPLCGGELKSPKEVFVAGVPVLVCSTECGKKLEKTTAYDRLQMVFGDPAFAKGFKMIGKAATPNPAAVPASKTAAVAPVSSPCACGCCCQDGAAANLR